MLTANQVAMKVRLTVLKEEFLKAWDKSPRTMVNTLKTVVKTLTGEETGTSSANALLHRMDV